MRKAGANHGYWDLALLFVLLTVPRLVTARTIFFPHYGDGDGLSMAIVVNNLSSERATGVLRAFAPEGSPQLLPFLSGSAEEVPLDLPPRGSKTLVTAGTSDPLKTGYLVLEMDTTEVWGVAIFRFANGMEASVAPSELGSKFSLPVECSVVLDTGLAVARLHETANISLTLFDSNGFEVGRRTLPLQLIERQTAKFVSELFEIDKPFKGVLVLESQQPFAAVGLRLGTGLLSTIPVLDLTDRPAPAANPSLILRRDSVYVERSRSCDDVTVNGAVWNKDLNDVCAVNLAVSALDDRGYFLGGSTTSLLGTNRKVGPSSTSYSCLQPGQTGYFSVVFPAGGEVAEVSVFPVGWIQPTSDPKSRLSVTSFSLTRPPWFVTRGTTVKGTVANEGTEGAKWIWIDVIFLDSGGRVLGVQSVIPYDKELDPNQSSRFEVTSTVALDQVDRVDFRLRWSDLSD